MCEFVKERLLESCDVMNHFIGFLSTAKKRASVEKNEKKQ
jgi:hypothetical protein